MEKEELKTYLVWEKVGQDWLSNHVSARLVQSISSQLKLKEAVAAFYFLWFQKKTKWAELAHPSIHLSMDRSISRNRWFSVLNYAYGRGLFYNQGTSVGRSVFISLDGVGLVARRGEISNSQFYFSLSLRVCVCVLCLLFLANLCRNDQTWQASSGERDTFLFDQLSSTAYCSRCSPSWTCFWHRLALFATLLLSSSSSISRMKPLLAKFIFIAFAAHFGNQADRIRWLDHYL